LLCFLQDWSGLSSQYSATQSRNNQAAVPWLNGTGHDLTVMAGFFSHEIAPEPLLECDFVLSLACTSIWKKHHYHGTMASR
jgi:hypothetical protein